MSPIQPRTAEMHCGMSFLSIMCMVDDVLTIESSEGLLFQGKLSVSIARRG